MVHTCIAAWHYLVCAIGAAVNIALLVTIAKRTPKKLMPYAVMMASMTLLQAVTCVTSLVTFGRLMPVGSTVFAVYSGPAAWFGNPWIPYCTYFIMLHGHAHYSIMLTACFAYRYYTIFYKPPTFKQSVVLSVLIYIPTIVIIAWFASAPNVTRELMIEQLTLRRPEYKVDGEVMYGFSSMLIPSSVIGVSWICLPAFPMFAVSIILSRKMHFGLLAKVGNMSRITRKAHADIIKAGTLLHQQDTIFFQGLLYQACLPILYTISVASYLIGQLELYNAEWLEYSTHMAGEMAAALSPIFTFYFVGPYRREVKCFIHRIFGTSQLEIATVAVSPTPSRILDLQRVTPTF